MSGTTCKEQCTQCRCIVKETPLKSGEKRAGKLQKVKQDRGANLECTEQYAKIANCMRKCMESKMNKNKGNDSCGDFKC